MLTSIFTEDDDENGHEDGSDGDETPEPSGWKGKQAELEVDDEDWPILPKHVSQSLSARKDIIRMYVTASYSKPVYYQIMVSINLSN
jgi:hypothetical protein